MIGIVQAHSTVGIERAALRLVGLNGALAHEGLLFPVSNFVVDQLRKSDRLHEGALFAFANAMVATGLDVSGLEKRILEEKFDVGAVPLQDKKKVVQRAEGLSKKSFETLKKYRAGSAKLRAKQGDPRKNGRPLKYVIVATGNIFEDVTQARSAAMICILLMLNTAI